MDYVIGTRGSKLALAQAGFVRDRLSKAYQEDTFTLRVIQTKGDFILDKPIYEIGDKGVFVREIEEKLLSGEIHIAVHSMKDMPADPAEGLTFAKAWKREDPRDALILREKNSLEELPYGAVIGTGSKRRELQLKKLRPDLKTAGIRGNVETRLRKMEEEKLDGIILAAAGLHRLGMEEKITRYLDETEMIPAPAQGILAIELWEGEEGLLNKINAFFDEESEKAAAAERGFLREIGGNCHTPAGAVLRRKAENQYCLDVMFGRQNGAAEVYASVCGENIEKLSRRAAASVRRQLAGKVYLVGAGPGDSGLITVKGLFAIRKADCIIYDRLASAKLLKEAKAGCELIYAGKEKHNHTMKQEEINRLLVKKSMEYETVVRLKGGDVYVFGRGGEEGLFLQSSGVPFEVIPGVSSAVAGPAYAGIPVTHRGVSSGFHVVTAHDKNDRLSDIDFKAMADGNETCIFLMGLSKAGEIAENLLAAGMPGNTKAAVISHATMPEQKICVSDLLHLAKDAAAAGLSSPAVIIVGDVVSLREGLNFFEKRPLFGKRYLIPKIGEGFTRLGQLLEEQGAKTDEIQVGAIQFIERKFTEEQFLNTDWLIFTSRNGVEAFFASFFSSGLDARSLFSCKIAAIGEKTADALKGYGLLADFVPKRFHGEAFAREFLKCLRKGGKNDPALLKIWHMRAKHAGDQMKEILGSICEFKETAVYENCALEQSKDPACLYEKYDGVFFTCASSVRRLTEAFGKEFGRCRAYSIGPKTTERLKRYGAENVFEAETASYEALADLCVSMEKDFSI